MLSLEIWLTFELPPKVFLLQYIYIVHRVVHSHRNYHDKADRQKKFRRKATSMDLGMFAMGRGDLFKAQQQQQQQQQRDRCSK